MSTWQYNDSGVYVFRCRRPGLFGRVPLIGRHFGYVGMSMHVRSRKSQHLKGSLRYNALPKSWTDLAPSWYYVPLPPWRWLLLTIETALIVLLWPVYNHQKNLWNPRRIPIKTAKRQRGQRDFLGWSFNMRYGHVLLIAAGITYAFMKGWIG